MEYETRNKSAKFLANIDAERKEENIDFYFMVNAYEKINQWFDNKGEHFLTMTTIKTLFADNVKVIWYEVDDSENSIAMFTRLNIGKIPLTSAELVKADLLADESSDFRWQFTFVLAQSS